MLEDSRGCESRLGQFLRDGVGEIEEIVRHVERCRSCDSLARTLVERGQSLLPLLQDRWEGRSVVPPEETEVRRSGSDEVSSNARKVASTEPLVTLDPKTLREAITTDYRASPTSQGDARAEDLTGRTFEDYLILEKLGQGGMGIVFRARQKSLDREVALKTLIWPREVDDARIDRFREEAQAIAALEHPQIIPIYAVGLVHGIYYYSMQLVEGGTLEARIRRGPIDSREAVNWLIAIAGAIAHAHQLGIIHRDLKPSNILMNRDGRPLVADFGLAVRIHQGAEGADSDGVAGTPSYMAPEQADPRVVRLTTAVDVYGLGAVLYAMLSGKPPFLRSHVADVLRLGSSDPPRLIRHDGKAIDPDLEAICRKCLEKDPGDRYPSALSLIEELRRYLDGRPVLARPISRSRTAIRAVRRQPVVSSLVALVVVVILGSGLLVTLAWLEARRQAFLFNRQAYVATIRLVNQSLDQNNWLRARDLFHQPIVQNSWLTGQDQPGFERDHLNRQLNRFFDSKEITGNQIIAVKYDPSGRKIAAAALDRLRIYDEQRPGLFLDLPTTSPIRDIAFSPDGRRLAAVDRSGTLLLIDPGTLAILERRKTGGAPMGAVAWSRDGKRLATLSGSKTVRLWDADGPGEPRLLPVESRGVGSLAFGRGDRLAVGRGDGTLVIWDCGQNAPSIVLGDQKGPIQNVAFDPAGDRVASADSDGTILVRDAVSGKVAHRFPGTGQRIEGLNFSPDGRMLAAAGQDQVIWLYDLVFDDPPKKLGCHVQTVLDLAFRPDGRRLVASAGDALKTWDLDEIADSYVVPEASRPTLREIAIDPQGRFVAACGYESRVWLWEAKGQRLVRSIDIAEKEKNEDLRTISFSPDGTMMAFGCASGLILVVNPETGATIGRFPGHQKGVRAVRFDPGGGRFFSVGDDGTLRAWDLATGRNQVLARVSSPIWSLAVDPRGRRLSIGETQAQRKQEQAVRVWDLATLREDHRLRGHTGPISSLAYSADGTRLASASYDGTIRVWDVEARRLACGPLKGHRGIVKDVAFTPDGHRLASGGADATIRIWSMAEGQDLLVIRGHTKDVTSLDFSTDGRALVSTGLDGQVRHW